MSWKFWERNAAKTITQTSATLQFTNTQSNKKEHFEAPQNRPVRMYSCGPTVYGPSHVGNLRAYIVSDLIRRTLAYNRLEVKQVINITDVGHLSSDADAGDDKMTKGLKRENMAITLENMRALGERYTKLLQEDLKKLSVDTTKIEFPRASDYIQTQIAMVQTLVEKGYAYNIKDGVYFDTSVFPSYGSLGNIDLEKLKEGARIQKNDEKRNPADFALWKFNKKLGWESPWGNGFPGWHIECSAMIRDLLGEQIDIHTGGIDLIPVHHNNEIAQSEAVTGKKPFARFWLHNAFLNIEDNKMAKSEGDVVYLEDIEKKDIHPLAFRYFLLQGHYRTPMNFTWEALMAAETALERLWKKRSSLPKEVDIDSDAGWKEKFDEVINDDLNTPQALAVMWNMLEDKELSDEVKLASLLDFDQVLGLGLEVLQESKRQKTVDLDILPKNIQKLVTEREGARKDKDWKKADALRDQLAEKGYEVTDTDSDSHVVLKR